MFSGEVELMIELHDMAILCVFNVIRVTNLMDAFGKITKQRFKIKISVKILQMLDGATCIANELYGLFLYFLA